MPREGYYEVPGAVVIHCIEGEIETSTPKLRTTLRPGQLAYLDGGTEQSVVGIRKSVVLLTIVLSGTA